MDLPREQYSDLRPTETVTFYPAIGHIDPHGGGWQVQVAGVVREPGLVRFGGRLLLSMFGRAVGFSRESLESEIFKQRIREFTAATQRGKRIVVRIGDSLHLVSRATHANGHFSGTLRFSFEQLDALARAGDYRDGWLRMQVVAPPGDDRAAGQGASVLETGATGDRGILAAADVAADDASHVGHSLLVPETGLSVISDIDDTIKHTEVTSREELLANTFLRRFQAIDGMAALYRSWADNGALFHYVSSSPWQLYAPLAELCRGDCFPRGTFHLRSFRLRDQMLRRIFRIRRHGKFAVLQSLIDKFPQRKFVLIGDSGERDPEYYGALARKFPSQVVSILIRQMSGRPLDPARTDLAFRQLSPHLWRIFESSEQLAGVFPINWENAPLATSN